jgi:hypothetical protein
MEKFNIEDKELWLTEFGWDSNAVGKLRQAENLETFANLQEDEGPFDKAFLYTVADPRPGDWDYPKGLGVVDSLRSPKQILTSLTSIVGRRDDDTPPPLPPPVIVLPPALEPPVFPLLPVPSPNPETPAGFRFLTNLRMGMNHPDVAELQRVLNRHGFTVASRGLGSPGNETMHFGALTRAAVVRFQETYRPTVLAPLGFYAGTGFVGQLTRTKLNELLAANP